MLQISVIIPVYNAEKTLKRCIESIVRNDEVPYEVILIDDCSKDSSLMICQSYAKRYSYIKVLHNEVNRGVSFTRNRGLDIATGAYIMFIDSDDWVSKNYFKTLSDNMEVSKCGIAICGYYNHDEKYNGVLSEVRWESSKRFDVIDAKECIESLYKKCLMQQLWNKIFDADVIQKNHIRFDESISIGEDFRLILDYLRHNSNKKVLILNELLYHYMRDQSGSLMYRVGYESVEEPLKNLRKMYSIMELTPKSIEKRIKEDKLQQINLYAYLIMHNAGMKHCEKKRLIYKLDNKHGKMLYKKNRNIFVKESVINILNYIKKI